MCNDRRREYLKSEELLGSWVAICHNCSALTGKLSPMPQTLGEIRAALVRERRNCERRWGKLDSRVFRYDRRSSERRSPAGQVDQVDDDMIVEISELAADLERLAAEEPELTRIQEILLAD
jgi:hypothetical protein